MIPTPWEFAVLALAIYRCARLVGWDTITEPIRTRLPAAVVNFLSCQYCTGFHFSWMAYLAWRVEPSLTLGIATIFALSGVAGFIATRPDA